MVEWLLSHTSRNSIFHTMPELWLLFFIVLAMFIAGGIAESIKKAKQERPAELDLDHEIILAEERVRVAKLHSGGQLHTSDAYQLHLSGVLGEKDFGGKVAEAALSIFTKRSMNQLDSEREREEIEAAVNGAMRLKLASDHELLEVKRLLLETLKDLDQVQSKEAREVHKQTLEHLRNRFNELCKKAV